jgi:hypothetical protein
MTKIIILFRYVDRAKILGLHNVSSKIPHLEKILNQYDFDVLVDFFKHSL